MRVKRRPQNKNQAGALTPQSRQPWITRGFALTPYDAGLGKQGLGLSNQQGHRPRGLEGTPPVRLGKHTPARGRPVRSISCGPATLNKQIAWSRR